MPINYPETPSIIGKTLPRKLVLHLSEGLNCTPIEGIEKLSFDAPTGSATLGYYKTLTELGKLGFEIVKIAEAIEVSPVARDYYQVTIAQKEQMEAQIKTHLASIATAISDLELAGHDFRRYKEFMDYYAMMEEGKRLIERGRKEEGEKLRLQGEQSLKHVFIDQVDVHTGEAVALKLIAPRWPTIIADFMKLTDEDLEQKKIKEKYRVSEAEAVILAAKNRVYLEWRDRLFKPAVESRFTSLLGLIEARKKSVEEYKAMVRPLMARYKSITEMLAGKGAGRLREVWIWRPDAQAISLDEVRIWAWKPFAPAEKYKITRKTLDTVKPAGIPPFGIGAGFWNEEVEEIKEALRKKPALTYAEELLVKEGLLEALPVEPSIDPVVRRFIDDIDREYGVEITALDLFQARQRLVDKFKSAMAGVEREQWIFSPYFIFLDIPVLRVHSRLPDGRELESLKINEITAATQTQNIIILHYLELLAREKQIERYIAEMLGEVGVSGKALEELEKELVFRAEEVKPKKRIDLKKPRYSAIQAAIKPFSNFFKYFGVEVPMLALGPYEFHLSHRITKFYQAQVAAAFEDVKNIFKSKFDVPLER